MTRVDGMISGQPLYLCEVLRPAAIEGSAAPEAMRRCGASLVPAKVDA